MASDISRLGSLDTVDSQESTLLTRDNVDVFFKEPVTQRSEREASTVFERDRAQERADIVSGRIAPKDNPEGTRGDKFISSTLAGTAQYASGFAKSLYEMNIISGTTKAKAVGVLDRFQRRKAGVYQDYYSTFRAKDADEFLDWAVASAGTGVGQMIPMIVSTMITGGIATKAKLTGKALTGAILAAQQSSTFMHIFGQEVEDMRSHVGDNASESQIVGMALLSTMGQTAIESAFGGEAFARSLFKQAGSKSFAKKMLAKFGKEKIENLGWRFMTGAVRVAGQGIGEGVEEIMQAYTHDISAKILNPEHQMSDFGELAVTQGLPAIPAGLLFGGSSQIVRTFKKGQAERLVKKTEEDRKRVLAALSEAELKGFTTKINQLKTDLLAHGNIQDEAGAVEIVNTIAKTALGLAHDTGRTPEEMFDLIGIVVAERGLDMNEWLAYEKMNEKDQQAWLEDNGLIKAGNAVIDEQIDKERKTQSDYLKADADKSWEEGRDILLPVLSEDPVSEEDLSLPIDGTKLETLRVDGSNMDLADIETNMPYGTGDPIMELIETRKNLLSVVRGVEEKDSATMRDIVRVTNAINAKLETLKAKPPASKQSLIDIASKIMAKQELSEEEEQERQNNNEEVERLLKDNVSATDSKKTEEAIASYEQLLDNEEDRAIIEEAERVGRDAERDAQKTRVEDKAQLAKQGKEQVKKFEERKAKAEPEKLKLPGTDIEVEKGKWLPIAAMPLEWFRAMYISNFMSNENEGDWINHETHEIMVPVNMSNSEVITPQSEGVQTAITGSDDVSLARRAATVRQVNEAEIISKLNAEVDELYDKLKDESLYSQESNRKLFDSEQLDEVQVKSIVDELNRSIADNDPNIEALKGYLKDIKKMLSIGIEDEFQFQARQDAITKAELRFGFVPDRMKFSDGQGSLFATKIVDEGEDESTIPKAQYFKHTQQIVFFPNATAQELLHEFFHHLRTRGLLTDAQNDILLKASGESEWNIEAEEFSARAFELYFMENRLPETVSREWIDTANKVRDYLSEYGENLIDKGYKLSDSVSNMFSKIIESAEKVEEVKGIRLNKVIANAVHASMNNDESLYSKAQVSKGNVKLFHALRKTYKDVTGVDAREYLRSIGKKSYLTMSHAKDDAIDQNGDMTDQEMATTRELLLANDNVRKAWGKKKKVSEVQKELDKIKTDEEERFIGLKKLRDIEASKESDMLTAASKVQPDSKAMRERFHSKSPALNAFRKLKTELFNWIASAENFFKDIDLGDGDGAFSKAFWDRIWASTRVYTSRVNDALDLIQEHMGANDVDTNKELYAWHTIDGKRYKLTQLIGIYMHDNNGNDKKLRKMSGINDSVITEATAIVKSSKAAQSVISAIDAYMKKTWSPLSKVASLVTGKKMGRVKNFYLSLVYDDANVDKSDMLERLEHLEGSVDTRSRLARSISAIKKRSDVARGGDIELDAVKVFLRYMYSAENYIAKAESTSYMLSMLGNEKLQDEIRKKHGPTTLRQMQELVSREMSPTGRIGEFGPMEKQLLHLRGKAVSAFLGYNPFTIARQPISLLTAMSYINGGHSAMKFVKVFYNGLTKGGLKIENLKADADFLQMVEESSTMKLRARQGLIDPEMDAEFMSKIKNNGLKGIRFFDMATITAVYTVARDQATAEGKSLKEAIAFAEKVIRKSQPPTTVSERALMQTSNEYVRSAIVFTGQPFKNWNIYMYDIIMPIYYGYKYGTMDKNGKRVANTKGIKGAASAMYDAKRTALMAVVIPAMAFAFIARKRLPETPREFFISLLAYPMSAFPILGASMARGIQGWDDGTYNTIWQSIFEGIDQELVEFARGDKSFTDGSDLYGLSEESLKFFFTVTGKPIFPMKVMSRVFEDLHDKGFAEDFPELMEMIQRAAGATPEKRR